MTAGRVAPSTEPDDDDLSLFALGTILLRHRWQIARWMAVGAVVAALLVAWTPALYKATASFIPQGGDGNRSGLASLAGQLGVALPTTNPGQSPEFYVRLLASRVVLDPVVRDTFPVKEMGGRRMAYLDVFEIEGKTPRHREELGLSHLRGLVNSSVAKASGAVEVNVATKWPSVSLAILSALVNHVNEFNQRTRQGQAAVERKFIEGRLTVASADLRATEDRLVSFLRTNRQFEGSPQLTFERERMQRDVSLKQQVFTTLTQAHEDARIREVRDTPLITVFEPPSVPALPEPRQRVRSVILGLLAGGSVGVLWVFASAMMARRRHQGNADAEEFAATVEEMKAGISNRARWLTGRVARRRH